MATNLISRGLAEEEQLVLSAVETVQVVSCKRAPFAVLLSGVRVRFERGFVSVTGGQTSSGREKVVLLKNSFTTRLVRLPA